MKKKATIYRMVTPDHLCPWGIKAYDLLKRNGYEIEDKHLDSSEANKAYKKEYGYDETPQIFIGEERLTYDDLREKLGLKPDPKEGKTYQPVVAIFIVTFAMAITASWAMAEGSLDIIRILELFIAFSMCVLGILKLQDLMSFATGFVQYDLVARRYVPYSYIYPYIEAGGGVLMIAGLFTWFVAPVVLIASTIGAISIIKAVYIDKRDLNCACVGGGSDVPLGFISLSENLMMITMAIWMLVK